MTTEYDWRGWPIVLSPRQLLAYLERAARRVLGAITVLSHLAASHLYEELLHHAACLGTGRNGLTERASVSPNLVTRLCLYQIRIGTQIGQKRGCSPHTLLECAGRWARQPAPSSAQYQLQFLWMTEANFSNQRRQCRNVSARKERIRAFGDSIKCRRLPNRAIATLTSGRNYSVALERGEMSTHRVISQA